MSPLVPLFTSAPATEDVERLVLDGLELNPDYGLYTLEGLVISSPRPRKQWAQGGDSDGSELIRDPLFDNREVTAQIRIAGATMDAALAGLGAITDKLEEAERQPDGLPLVWTPAGSSKTVTFYVLSGGVEELPIAWEAGWFVNQPLATLKLDIAPFGYEPWVVGPSVTSADPLVTLVVPGVPGDVAAEARLVVTDGAGVARRHVEWGMEQRHYDAATSLRLDSDDLVTTGYAGVQGTRTGAYDPNAAGTNVVAGTAISAPQALCGTGELTHVGVFRVKARVWCASADARIRLAWRVGGAQARTNTWTAPPIEGLFTEVDLGLISIPRAGLGAQRFSADVEAYYAVEQALFSPTTVGVAVDIDHIMLIPVGEGFGRARAPYAPKVGRAHLFDDFGGATAGTALNGRSAAYGTATWATSGFTGDFLAHDFPDGVEAFRRATASDPQTPPNEGRFALLGASLAYQRVETLYYSEGSGNGHRVGVLARYIDASNFLRLRLQSGAATSTRFSAKLVLEQVVGGVTTQLMNKTLRKSLKAQQWYLLSLEVDTNGRTTGFLSTRENPRQPIVEVYALRPELATGGALASGKPGWWDHNIDNNTKGRIIKDFHVEFGTSAVEQSAVVIHPTRALEFNSEETLRQDEGLTWSRPPSFVGDRFLLEPAGALGRSTRLAVKAHAEDVEVNESKAPSSLTVQVHYRPRRLYPR